MERIAFIICDNCGKDEEGDKRPADDTRWISVRFVPPMSSAVMGNIVGDYCSVGCLHAVIIEDRLGVPA